MQKDESRIDIFEGYGDYDSRTEEDAMEQCDHCGELMCECTCHEPDFYDGDF